MTARHDMTLRLPPIGARVRVTPGDLPFLTGAGTVVRHHPQPHAHLLVRLDEPQGWPSDCICVQVHEVEAL